MVFIMPHQVPAGRKVTYANFICTMQPGKAEPYRICMTVGRDRLDAYQDVCSPAPVGVTDTKLHLNSVILIHCRYLTPEIIAEYALTNDYLDSKGYIYVEILKGMYGLKMAAILAYDQLKAHLVPFGYFPVPQTPGLLRHVDRRTTFTLAVDGFGIRFFAQADADHLFDALATKYALAKDWSGSSYLGFKIDWNYEAGYVVISMPNYVPKALLTFRHPLPTKPQHSPHRWTAPVYGQKLQLATNDISPLLDKLGIKCVQQVSGLFLYYSRWCDPTIIVALNEIFNNQASPTEHTKKACDMLLD
jgi:hypothetical protein